MKCTQFGPITVVVQMLSLQWGFKNISLKFDSYYKQMVGNKLKGVVGDIVSLQAQMSPYFQMRVKFKFIEQTKVK